LLSPLGSPSVISTIAFTWQATQSGLLAPVGAVKPLFNQMLLELEVNAVFQVASSPLKNWPTLSEPGLPNDLAQA